MKILNIFKNKTILLSIMVIICFLGIAEPKTANADSGNTYCLVALEKATQTIKVVITAYSSSPEETDDTPFITASGKYVRDGIVANNMLPIGTQIKIPDLYGDKVFTVEDRMNRRMGSYRFDIWFPNKTSALNFGVKTAEIEILEN